MAIAATVVLDNAECTFCGQVEDNPQSCTACESSYCSDPHCDSQHYNNCRAYRASLRQAGYVSAGVLRAVSVGVVVVLITVLGLPNIPALPAVPVGMAVLIILTAMVAAALWVPVSAALDVVGRISSPVCCRDCHATGPARLLPNRATTWLGTHQCHPVDLLDTEIWKAASGQHRIPSRRELGRTVTR